jgi:hypothetical protein
LIGAVGACLKKETKANRWFLRALTAEGHVLQGKQMTVVNFENCLIEGSESWH